ncbi:hypothetical protein BGZ76_002892 [Entomortierella beljakovae]|nr:hypothetical protein BGZ76_002892 [Entomortierella beljakovae]
MAISDSTRSKSETISNLTASSIAAFISRLFTHPLDTVKTRVQVSNKPLPLLPTFIDLLKTGGLYRGLPIALTLSVPGLSVYLTAYDISKQKISSQFPYLGTNSVFNHLGSAAIAETFSGLFWTPMEVLKSKQQVENFPLTPTKSGRSTVTSLGSTNSFSTITSETPKSSVPTNQCQAPISTLELARKIYRHEGILGFYRGYFITLGVFV